MPANTWLIAAHEVRAGDVIEWDGTTADVHVVEHNDHLSKLTMWHAKGPTLRYDPFKSVTLVTHQRPWRVDPLDGSRVY